MNKVKEIEVQSQIVPEPRSGTRSVCIEGNIIIFGGYNKNLDNSTYREIWVFNLYRKQWYKLLGMEKCPRSVASSSLVYYNGSLIIFGGCGFPFSHYCDRKLYLYNLLNASWLEILDSIIGRSKPSAKYGHIMQLHKDKLFIHSGTKGREFLNELHSFCFRKFKWKELKPTGNIPLPRYRHESVVHKSNLYIFGGGNNLILFGFKSIHCLNLNSINWSEIKCQMCPLTSDYPLPRKAHSVELHNDHVFMCGGLANGDVPLKDIWKLSLITFQWTKLDISLPTELYFHSSAISSEGCLFIFGGVDNHEHRNNKILSFWTTVPSLNELCWELVSQTKRNILENSIIPPYIINRTFDWSTLLRTNP